MDTQNLIDQQTKRKELFKALVDSINEKGKGRALTRSQFLENLNSLDKLCTEFKNAHQNILAYGKPDIPYIVNRSGEQVIEVMITTIEGFKNTSTLPNQDLMDITLGTGQFNNPNDQTFHEPNDNQNATGENNSVHQATWEGHGTQDTSSAAAPHLIMRKLNYKISKLLETLETIQNELSTTLVWTKELFEVKNRFLYDQWNVISALEEDIVINYNITLNTTKPVYVQMNEVISKMIEKIQHTHSSHNLRRSKLPDLKIPVFNGDYKKWRNFIDIFNTTIHNRQDMPMVEKMEYLKGYTEGEPNNLIKNYLLSSDNYIAAYEVLEKRYNNKRKLFTIYVDNMIKPIGKNATSESVKELYDGITEGMKSIENMGIENVSWGPLVVHLAIRSLDQESRALFEARYNNDTERENSIPQLDDFLNFLESRFKTLEILDPMRANSINKVKANQGSEKKFVPSTFGTDNKQSVCIKCEGDHRLFMCPKFIALSVKSRYRFVKFALTACINTKIRNANLNEHVRPVTNPTIPCCISTENMMKAQVLKQQS